MKARGRPRHPETLTPRQQDVWRLLRRGLTNEEIAQQLGISADGVKYHVSDILRRLHVGSRHEAAAWRPERERRPWALGLVPVGWMHKLKWSTVGYAASGAVLAAAAVGVGLLIWGVTRTTNSDEQAALLTDVDRIIAPEEIPALPPGQSQVLSYDTRTGGVDELPFPALEPAALSDDGSVLVTELGTVLLFTDQTGAQHSVDRNPAGGVPTDWSGDGERMLVVGSEGLRELRTDTGAVTELMTGNIQTAVWSPDERRIAFVRDQQLGVLDLANGESRLVAPDLTAMYLPNFYARGRVAWSPDGETIAFAHWTPEEPVTQGRSDIYLVRPDGTDLRRLTNSPRAKADLLFSPDGDYLAFVQNSDDGDRLRLIELETGREIPLDAFATMSFPTTWIADDALLTSNFGGISLARTDGTVRLLIATTDTCTRSLIGWASDRIVFRNVCHGIGN